MAEFETKEGKVLGIKYVIDGLENGRNMFKNVGSDVWK